MRVLICGSRTWDAEQPIREALESLVNGEEKELVVIHGAARGADCLGGEIAEELGIRVEEYPADWDRDGRSAGYKRNEQMLNTLTKSDVVLAFWDGRSRGTEHMIQTAQNRGICVKVIRGPSA